MADSVTAHSFVAAPRTLIRRTRASKMSSARPYLAVRAAEAGVPTIFGAPGSRTQIVEWACLELGVEFKSVTLNRAVMKSDEYRAVHPFGKIPGMKAADGETGIFESGALMLYVADLSGSLSTPEQRGAAASWVIWANATMWPALEASRGKGDLDALFGPVDQLLGERKWLLGDEFSVADMAVGAYVKYGQMFFGMKIPKTMARLEKFMTAVEAMPHFKKTVGGG
jgi:glutathione S-transferase